MYKIRWIFKDTHIFRLGYCLGICKHTGKGLQPYFANGSQNSAHARNKTKLSYLLPTLFCFFFSPFLIIYTSQNPYFPPNVIYVSILIWKFSIYLHEHYRIDKCGSRFLENIFVCLPYYMELHPEDSNIKICSNYY